MNSFHAAYVQAVETSRSIRETRDALLETPEEYVVKVESARLKLKETILETAVKTILESCRKGPSHRCYLCVQWQRFLG